MGDVVPMWPELSDEQRAEFAEALLAAGEAAGRVAEAAERLVRRTKLDAPR